jgi:hypothetical protein
MEMTIIEALCVLNTGWKTEQEKKLREIADDIVSKESLKLHLEYQKKMIEKKLQNFKEEL